MKNLALLIGALIFSGDLYAVDAVSVEYGYGDAIDMMRIGASWDREQQWFTEGDWLVTSFWELGLGSWRGRSSAGSINTITDLGLTPVFRLQQKAPGSVAPYVEAAIGVHLITPTLIDVNRQFGSAFKFGDHLGIGMRFGEHQQFDLAYRLQHLSNGGLMQPNYGVNFNQLHFSYHF